MPTKRALRLTPKGLALLQAMERGEGGARGRLEGPEAPAGLSKRRKNLHAAARKAAEAAYPS